PGAGPLRSGSRRQLLDFVGATWGPLMIRLRADKVAHLSARSSQAGVCSACEQACRGAAEINGTSALVDRPLRCGTACGRGAICFNCIVDVTANMAHCRIALRYEGAAKTMRSLQIVAILLCLSLAGCCCCG